MHKIFRAIMRFILKPIFRMIYRYYIPNFKKDFQCAVVFMIAQLPGGEEEWKGIHKRKAYLGNTHPWNRYFNKPLQTKPKSLKDIEKFLRKCKYRTDRQTRSQQDFWEPPDIFEKRCSGDCEDHSIWAWRQLFELGYRARLVLGRCRNGRHAWVHVFINNRCYLLEATIKHTVFPNSKEYKPEWSIEYVEKKKFLFFAHFE